MEQTPDMTAAASIDVKDLMAHDAWLRGMVRDLVEPDLVADVVQETFLAAWLQGRVQNLPGFLRRVGRNLALRHRRSEGRRRRRELSAARTEALPATGQMLERLEAHRTLTAAVAELEEPYRTTILLRYFEGLSPKEIAARQGLPASTVRTHLERGLGQLRTRLQGTDLRALSALFLWPDPGAAPLPVASNLAATLFAGAALMTVHTKSIVLLAGLLLLASAGVWYWNPLGVEAAGGDEQVPITALADTAEPPAAASERQPLDSGAPSTATSSTGPVLRGRVLDTRGVPLAGVALLIDKSDPQASRLDALMRVKRQPHPLQLARARTDREGRFALDADRLGPDVEVDARLGAGYVPLWLYLPRREDWPRKQVLVVAAAAMSLAGRVVDEDGTAVAGAIVAAHVPGLVGFPFPLEDAQTMSLPNTTTDATGNFSLANLPDIPELELWVLATGFHLGICDRQDDQRLIVLQREGARDSYRIRGTVVDRGLRVVEGALVRIGGKETRTDARGRFDLAFKLLRKDTHLYLGKEGHCTLTCDEHLEDLRAGKRKQAVVVLTLGDTPQEITGKVVDGSGQPVPDVVVVLEDAVFLDFLRTGEDLALGRKSKLDSSTGAPMMIDARTDGTGSFRVGGLAPRPYRLHVFDPKTLVGTTTAPIAAGTKDLVVDFPKGQVFAELRGVVRTTAGAPLVDVEVKCSLLVFKSGYTSSVSTWAPGDITRTDTAGRFVLKRVPKTGVELKVSGGEVLDFDVAIEDAAKNGAVVLVPPLRCHFRVQGARADADAIQLLDLEGRVVTVFKKSGQMSMSGEKWTLRRGRTTTLATSEKACTLVYLDKAGRELARKPIQLEPGRVNDLE